MAWQTALTAQIPAIFSRHEVAVLCHIVAKSIRIIAAAHGSNLPVVVTPVGGLTHWASCAESRCECHRR
jgi:hypothetical protein